MEISAEKTKMSYTNAKSINNNIIVKGTTLENVNQFTYLGALVTDNGSKPDLSRMAKAQNSLSKLKVIWDDKSNSLASKIRFLRSKVIPIFYSYIPICLRILDWTLDTDLEKSVASFEMKCLRRLLGIR